MIALWWEWGMRTEGYGGLARFGSHKANGAGIAADPTLTGVWTPPEGGVLDAWRDTRSKLRIARPALAPVPDVPGGRV